MYDPSNPTILRDYSYNNLLRKTELTNSNINWVIDTDLQICNYGYVLINGICTIEDFNLNFKIFSIVEPDTLTLDLRSGN